MSFASMEEKDCPSSPDKCADGASEELPPSPCRGKRRSTYSFGLHSQSLGCEDTPVDGSDGLEAKAGMPSSPPDSPGRLRQFWACMKQRQEELENKQRHLEEWDFELKEEKRQQRESRLFLARKMSELEAKELRASKREERRLSALSGTPASSMERTPPSSSKPLSPSSGMSPERFQSFAELIDTAAQTEETTAGAAAAPAEQERCRPHPCRRATSLCKRLFHFGVALQFAVKACVLIGVVVVPELPSEAVESIAAWLPVPLETFVSLETGSDNAPFSDSTSVVPATVPQAAAAPPACEICTVPQAAGAPQACENCEKALQDAHLELTRLQYEHDQLQHLSLPVDEKQLTGEGDEQWKALQSHPDVIESEQSSSPWGWRALSMLVIVALAGIRSCA